MDTLIHSIWGAIHTGAAVFALLVGPILFLRAKGGVSHRILGYGYVAAMVVVCLAGWPIRNSGAELSPFHYLSIVSLVTVLLGAAFAFAATRIVRSARSRDGLVHGHLYWMGWSYIGLAAAGLAQVGSRLVSPEEYFGSGGWIAVAVASGAAIGVGALILQWTRPALARRYFPTSS
ncbi:MAG: DUF2306 domain-containing protein [Oceanicaulis sp.]